MSPQGARLGTLSSIYVDTRKTFLTKSMISMCPNRWNTVDPAGPLGATWEILRYPEYCKNLRKLSTSSYPHQDGKFVMREAQKNKIVLVIEKR